MTLATLKANIQTYPVTHVSLTANNSQPLSQHELDTILSESVDKEYLSMVYQPIFGLNSCQLIGFESLVRCDTPKYGRIPPDVFIPRAEETGNIIEIGEWIYKKTLSDLKTFVDSGLPNLCMSLNLSPVQLTSGTIFDDIMLCINKNKLTAKNIKLELTETALMSTPEKINALFIAFQQEGLSIWVDDFGTGFSSLSLLRKFNINGLKIDKSFVDGIIENNNDFNLCSAVIAMAQRLGMTTVAEGIEHEEQLQILTQMGCDNAQGYLMGKPETLETSLLKYEPR